MTAIYARQSADKKDSVSIESQISLCKAVTGTDIDNIKIYEDRGYSGKDLKRPAYTAMIHDIKQGIIDRVIVYRLDRLSRSVGDFSHMWEIFEKYNVTFTSVNESFDTDNPMGKAMIYIIMTFAQLERETIVQRVTDNYYERLKYGSWPGGRAPLGFDNSSIISEGRKTPTLSVNSDMNIVRYIFSEYLRPETTLSSIGKNLTEACATGNVHKMKKKGWDNVTISRIIHSPVYVKATEKIYFYYLNLGLKNFINPPEHFTGNTSAYLIGKRKAGHTVDIKEQTLALTNFPGIIDDDTWLKCQYKMSLNLRSHISPSLKYSWLTGLLKCSSCGYSIVIKNSGNHLYMCCSGRYNLHICHVRSLPWDCFAVEHALWHIIEGIIIQAEAFWLNASACKNPTDTAENVLIDMEIDSLIALMPDAPEPTLRYLNRRINRLDFRKKALSVEQTKNPKSRRDVELFHVLKDNNLTNEERHLIAETLIESIKIDEKHIEIFWKK